MKIFMQTDLDWLFVYPKGIHYLMVYIRDKYKNPNIYITENGKYYPVNFPFLLLDKSIMIIPS